MSSIYQSRKLYGYLGMSAQDVPITNKSTAKYSRVAPFKMSRLNDSVRDLSVDFGNLRGASLANLVDPA